MLAKGVSGMSIPADAGRDHPGPEVAPDPSDPAFGAETGEGPDPSFGPEAAEEERVEYGESDSSFGGDVGDAGWGRH
jgi:hypothetical protein